MIFSIERFVPSKISKVLFLRRGYVNMTYSVVPRSKHLTSFVFFNDILFQTNRILDSGSPSTIVFDFSYVETINPLMIPNFLCLGLKCRSKRFIPFLIVPSSLSSKYNIIGYLYDLGFKQISDQYKIFDLEENLWGGFDHYEDLDATLMCYKQFDDDEKIKCRVKIAPILRGIDYGFGVDVTDVYGLIEELVENSIDHGNSLAFLSVTYTKKYKLLQISESDMGMGLYSSLDYRTKRWPVVFDPNRPVDPSIVECITMLMKIAKEDYENRNVYSILCAILFRCKIDDKMVRQTIYGIFSVFYSVLNKEGTIRLHSNDTQVILTNNHAKYFKDVNNGKRTITESMTALAKSIIASGKNSDISKSNLRKGLNLSGVHFEIDLKINRQGRNSHDIL